MIVFIPDTDSNESGLLCRTLGDEPNDLKHFRFYVYNGAWDGEYCDGLIAVDYTGHIYENGQAISDQSQFPEWTHEYLARANRDVQQLKHTGTVGTVESFDLSDDLPF